MQDLQDAVAAEHPRPMGIGEGEQVAGIKRQVLVSPPFGPIVPVFLPVVRNIYRLPEGKQFLTGPRFATGTSLDDIPARHRAA